VVLAHLKIWIDLSLHFFRGLFDWGSGFLSFSAGLALFPNCVSFLASSSSRFSCFSLAIVLLKRPLIALAPPADLGFSCLDPALNFTCFYSLGVWIGLDLGLKPALASLFSSTFASPLDSSTFSSWVLPSSFSYLRRTFSS
jgi:hypothetical protein